MLTAVEQVGNRTEAVPAEEGCWLTAMARSASTYRPSSDHRSSQHLASTRKTEAIKQFFADKKNVVVDSLDSFRFFQKGN